MLEARLEDPAGVHGAGRGGLHRDQPLRLLCQMRGFCQAQQHSYYHLLAFSKDKNCRSEFLLWQFPSVPDPVGSFFWGLDPDSDPGFRTTLLK